MKRTPIYKCDRCGAWSRVEYKILTDGKAICMCGAEMRKAWKILKEMENPQKTAYRFALSIKTKQDMKKKKRRKRRNAYI